MPSLRGGLARNFLAFFGRERIGAGAATLQAALAAKSDGGRVFVRIVGAIRRAVFDLAGENVADQLSELDGIVRAFEAGGCHARIMA